MSYTDPNDAPLEQRRGYESSDCNIVYILVRAPIEQTAQAFSKLRQVQVWIRDVLERKIEMLSKGVVVFQFREHPWTIVSSLSHPLPITQLDAQLFSRYLNTRAIYCMMSDTMGELMYILYDNGTCIEILSFGDDDTSEEEEQEKEVDLYEYMEVHKPCSQLQSQIHQIEAKDFYCPYGMLNGFLIHQDAYVPSKFLVERRIASSNIGILQLVDYRGEDFERMDYLGLK